MAKEKGTGIVKALLGSSFLVTLALILLFLFFNVDIYKQNTEIWSRILGAYLIAFSLTLSIGVIVSPKIIKALATANYWKSFALRFLPSAVITLTILILIKGLIKGTTTFNPLTVISYVPLPVLLFHLFVVSQIEEIMFGGVIYESVRLKYGNKAANYMTLPLFGIFHFAKTGGSIVVMMTYVPLRYWWNYIRNNGTPLFNKIPKIQKLFSATPKTQQVNAGSHFAWNMFIIGLLKPTTI